MGGDNRMRYLVILLLAGCTISQTEEGGMCRLPLTENQILVIEIQCASPSYKLDSVSYYKCVIDKIKERIR